MAATTLSPGQANPTILLASPDAATVELLKAALEAWRYPVLLAGDGLEARTRLEASAPPEIAFLDMNLPPPGGVEIVWSLRHRQPRTRTWLALLSKRPGSDRVRAALEAGCDDLLFIPPEPDEVRVRIRIAERMLALQDQLDRQSAELHYRSTHDGLTGLWNREALLSMIFQETDRVQRMKTPLSLLLMDLDDFSRINHEYGYAAGDRALTELANRFRRQLRSYDLIGRCGEDEFLLALPGCSVDSAMKLAARIRQSILSRPFALNGEASTLTASFGVTSSGGRSPVVVLREAEQALAQAKLEGKNRARCHAPETPLGMELPPLHEADSVGRRAG